MGTRRWRSTRSYGSLPGALNRTSSCIERTRRTGTGSWLTRHTPSKCPCRCVPYSPKPVCPLILRPVSPEAMVGLRPQGAPQGRLSQIVLICVSRLSWRHRGCCSRWIDGTGLGGAARGAAGAASTHSMDDRVGEACEMRVDTPQIPHGAQKEIALLG